MCNHCTYHTAPAEARFWAKVDKNGPVPAHRPELGRCWIWTASRRPTGYGTFGVSHGTCVSAHRYSYALHNAIAANLEIDHLCRVRACVNPAHLEAVTHTENVRRSEPASKSHCLRGHERTVANTLVAKSGKRACRICMNAHLRRYRAEKKAAMVNLAPDSPFIAKP